MTTGAAVTGCETGPSENERLAQQLLPHAQTAFQQEEAARRIAGTGEATAEQELVLDQLAAERGAHRTALTDEINRLHSPLADQVRSEGRGGQTLDQLLSAVGTAGGAAAQTAVELSGFPAGLLGSVGAACLIFTEVHSA